MPALTVLAAVLNDEYVFELPRAVRVVRRIQDVSRKTKNSVTFTVKSFASGTVVYERTLRPKVSGNKLAFIRSDWEPTAADDLGLYFDFGRPTVASGH